ncbi:MAG TPA: hypothetical protein VM600_08990 [Actinomycetota bacterium]|nr:hypothetical protein [Actinomycetota bacterium]
MAATYARRGARVIIASALIALAATTLPARAAGDPAPILASTSVDSGWSKLTTVVAFDYGTPSEEFVIDRAASDVELLDRDGAKVTGVIDRATDTSILFFKPDGGLRADRAPYSITVSARAVGQDPEIDATVTERTFRVDPAAPKSPVIASPTSTVAIVGPSDVAALEIGAKDEGASGIAKLLVNVYNPAETLPQGRVDASRRFEVAQNCSGGFCPITVNAVISDQINALPSGFWTLKVAAIDLAGNVSPESKAVSFLIVRTPS